jgi:halorhodopsin
MVSTILQATSYSQVVNNTSLELSFVVNILLAGLTILASLYFLNNMSDPRAKSIGLLAMMISVVSISSYTGLWSGLTLSLIEMPAGHAKGGMEVLVMWGRYLTWALSTPFILIVLGMLAGSNWVKTGTSVALTIAMCVTGLAAALITTSVVHRWLFFAISSAFFLGILYIIFFEWSEEAEEQGTSDIFSTLKIITIVTWFGYPLLWFVGVEGLALLPVGLTSWGYSLLDILAKYIVTILILRYVSEEPDTVTGGGDYAEL